MTLYAFSTENWNRPKSEITLLFRYLDKFFKEINNYHVDKEGKLVEGKINLQAINEESEILSIYNITEEMIEKIVDDILELISAPFDIELQDIDYDDLAAEAAG